MATFACRPERPVMGVILAVTSHALCRQRGLYDVLLDVAGVAIEAAMGSRQRVTRLCVVIVAPTLPAIRVVTKRTVLP